MPSPGAYKPQYASYRSDEKDFVNAKSHAREKKPLLAGYSNVKTEPYQLLSIYSDY